MNKLKVIWICSFSNPEIREKLSLSTKTKYSDAAPWITSLIKEYQDMDRIELSIISPHKGLTSFSQHFVLNGINYFFYNYKYPFSKNYFQILYPYWLPFSKHIGFLFTKLLVKKTIKNINPDIIHLIGAENPYYSTAILGIKNYPILISTQTVYSNPIRKNWVKPDKKRLLIEQSIFKQNKYIAVNASFMPELIEKYCPNPIFFKGGFPISKPVLENTLPVKKEYDFVFFARLAPNKGGVDALKALAIIKKNNPNVSLLFIGIKKGNPYSDSLEKLAKTLNIQENVYFLPSYEKQEELWKMVIKAKIYVLPTKIDTIPGTILESICMGLPIITYETGDIPSLNAGGIVRVLIAEKENIEQLAFNMNLLLNNTNLQKELAEKAKNYIFEKYYDNTKIANRILQQYQAIIQHYKHEIPIPKELLFKQGDNII